MEKPKRITVPISPESREIARLGAVLKGQYQQEFIDEAIQAHGARLASTLAPDVAGPLRAKIKALQRSGR